MTSIQCWQTPNDQNDQNEQLLSLLFKAARNELLSYQIYAYLTQNPRWTPISNISHLIQVAEFEDWEHYREIINCIERLNGDVNSMLKYTSKFQALKPWFTVHDCLALLRTTETVSVNAYTEMCMISMEYDYRVFDLSYRNLHENIQHQRVVTEALNNNLCIESTSQKSQAIKEVFA
jgi:ferritin-like protein